MVEILPLPDPVEAGRKWRRTGSEAQGGEPRRQGTAPQGEAEGASGEPDG